MNRTRYQKNSITRLPDEVLYHHILHDGDLSADDVRAFGKTCHRFNKLSKPVWRQKKAAATIQELWSSPHYIPSPEEVGKASMLATNAKKYLPPEVLAKKADQLALKFESHFFSERRESYHHHLPLIRSAAALASRGHSSQVPWLGLYHLDISSVSAEDLTALARCVRDKLVINAVSGDLTPVFDGLHCSELLIYGTPLNTVETQSLLAAMNRGIGSVNLGVCPGKAELDFEILTQYDGAGACKEISLFCDTKDMFGNRLKQWAAGVTAWEVTFEDYLKLVVKRI